MTEPLVLVAHENDALRREIEVALADASLQVLSVADGRSAERLLVQRHPAVLVVDVGISGRAAFELCDRVAALGLRTRVILVASVYNHTRYKRRPTSLYGADDYVEQHHIHDMLRTKVERLLGRDVGPATPGRVDPERAQRVQAAGDAMLTIRYDTPEQGRARAQSLCELLVADVVLYAGSEVDAVAAGAPLSPRLAEDLDEARRIFSERVPAPLRQERDWVAEAFDAIVARRRASARAHKMPAVPPADDSVGERRSQTESGDS